MNNADYMAMVRAAIAQQKPELAAKRDELSAEVGLDEIGLDSLATVEVLLSLSSRFDVDLETAFEGLSPPRTVGDLAHIASTFAK